LNFCVQLQLSDPSISNLVVVNVNVSRYEPRTLFLGLVEARSGGIRGSSQGQARAGPQQTSNFGLQKWARNSTHNINNNAGYAGRRMWNDVASPILIERKQKQKYEIRSRNSEADNKNNENEEKKFRRELGMKFKKARVLMTQV
jgi:hypothetical protein